MDVNLNFLKFLKKQENTNESDLYVVNMLQIASGIRRTILVKGISEEEIKNKLINESKNKDNLITIKILYIKSIGTILKGIENTSWNIDKLISFSNRYLSLLNTNMPGPDILETLYRETNDKVVLKLLYECNSKNKFLDEAMSMMPKVFPEDYVGIVKASRKIADFSGIMTEIIALLNIKKSINTEIKGMRSKIVIPTIMALSLLLGMSLKMTPNIIQMYGQFHQESMITPLTMYMYYTSLFIMNYSIYLIGLLFCLFVPFSYKYKTDDYWRYSVDEMILGIPIFGKLFSYFYEIQFLRIIALAKKAQIPDIEAFELAKKSQTNMVFIVMMDNIKKALNNNEDLGIIFGQNLYLSEDVSQIYRLAIKSNSIESMFGLLAKSKENYMKESLFPIASKASEFANKLILGTAVLLLAYSIYFPMMNISSAAQKSAL